MRVASIVGARPQFVKAATVSRALRAYPDINEILIHTGQHYDDSMSKVFFQQLRIPNPDYHLGIGGGTHGQNTGRMIEAIEKVLVKERPDWVLVYGDTDSTLAGALAAAKLHIQIAHVEAGLRSFNRSMPEEINRVLTDHAADVLFAPTEAAVENLLREGISPGRVHLVGDVMYDAALFYGERAERDSRILERLTLSHRGYMLATIHRAENTDDAGRLRVCLAALSNVAREILVVLPLHPRTRAAIERFGLWEFAERVLLTDPVGYLDMVRLEKHARLIATDSGGVQKEAFFHRVPCLTLREETEWVELVQLGWNRLCSPRSEEELTASLRQMQWACGTDAALYGAGKASEAIVSLLRDRR